MKSLIILALVGSALCAPQGVQLVRINTAIDDNSGQYKQDNSGAYNGDDGQYHPDGSGAYRGDILRPYQGVNIVQGRVPVHYLNTFNRDVSGQYRHDNSGAYNNDDGQYHPDGSGAYNPDNLGGYQNIINNAYSDKVNAGRPIVTARPVHSVPIHSGSSNGVVRDHIPASNNGHYAIIRQVQENQQDGYHYVYETENQIYGEEEGHLENVGSDQEGITVRGRYSYTGPDNVVYSVEYTADAAHGFVASGAHLPQANNGQSS